LNAAARARLRRRRQFLFLAYKSGPDFLFRAYENGSYVVQRLLYGCIKHRKLKLRCVDADQNGTQALSYIFPKK
jgi:hypothetical protein